MSEEHEERISKLFAGALPPKGTAAYKAIQERINLSKNSQGKQYVSKQLEIFVSSCTALLHNGIGYPVDSTLRYYVKEFNHRAATAGLYSMPTSFGFMEAFMDYKRPLAIFLPKPEYNTLCSFTDFLDWATSNNQEPNEHTLKSSIESNRAHLFSNTSNPQSLKFRCANGIEVGVLSAGIVRDRNEVVIFLQIVESETGDDFDPHDPFNKARWKKQYPFAAAQKEGLTIADDLVHERVQPSGIADGYESVAMMRFDIQKQAVMDRAIYQDWGDSYRAVIDVIHIFGAKNYESATDEQRKMYDSNVQSCNGYQEVFELCRQFALLPMFESSYAAHTQYVEQPTNLKARSSGIAGQKWLSKAIDETRVFTRRLGKINTPRDEVTGNLIIKIPSYTFESSGYWKILAPWEAGFDERGLPEQGRTWVKQERPERTGHSAHELEPSTFVKAPKADATRATFGFIYVMRSAQHETNVFKVGLTTRETRIRAQELTRKTSSVDQFSVMQEWEVTDCHKAESEIHKLLDSFRVNKKREFFKCEYQHIFGVIHRVVDAINQA